MSFPTWVWLYFGAFGTAGALLYTLVAWTWMKVHSLVRGWLRSAAKWDMVGLMFLFVAAYFACGIVGPPGSLLSHDRSTHDPEAAYASALLAVFFSVPGWACVLVGTLSMLRGMRAADQLGTGMSNLVQTGGQ